MTAGSLGDRALDRTGDADATAEPSTDLPAELSGSAFAAAGSLPVHAMIDVVAIALGVVLAGAVAFDLDLADRWPVAIAYFGWVPGWVLVRLAGLRASAISLLVSMGLSVALVFLTGQILVAAGWGAWRTVTVSVCVATVAALVHDLRRARL